MGPGWQGRERKVRLCRYRAWCRWDTLDVDPYGYRGEGSWEGFGQRRKPAPKRPGLPVSADSF